MFSEQQQSQKIYNLWQKQNKIRHAFFILGLGNYVTVFMLLFDYLFVQNPVPFILSRLLVLLVFCPAFLYCLRAHFAAASHLKGDDVLLALVPCVLHIQCFYLVFVLPHEKVQVYFTGLLLIIFYGTFVLHKFRNQQLAFNILGAMATIPFAFVYPQYTDFVYITVVCHLVACFIFVYFRRDFKDNLASISNLLLAVVPAKVAETLATSHNPLGENHLFKARERFTVCLCADWRNFQQLALTRTSDELSEMLEIFYDSVLQTLEQQIPTNNYYFNWTADELFIIFFAEDEKQTEQPMRDALVFAKTLATHVFEDFCKKLGTKVYFDVGLSSGKGLLGLQGPRYMKKTTIAGEVGGRSKRFETEAKRLRDEQPTPISPGLVMDENLYHFGVQNHIFSPQEIKALEAKGRNVAGLKCYYWVSPLTSLEDSPQVLLQKTKKIA